MLGEKIKKLRTEINFTQSMLAKKLGISTSAIGMYEQSRRSPHPSVLLEMCKFFNVSSDYLLFDADPCDNSGVCSDMYDIIDNIKAGLLSVPEITFKGKKVSDEDLGKIIDSVKIAAETILNQKQQN